MDANFAWGIVNADGSPIDGGSGNWSSFRQSTGVYRVTVNRPTGGTLAIVASGYRLASSTSTPDPGQDNCYSARILNEEAFEVYSYDTGQNVQGELQDAAFSFLAIWRPQRAG